MTRKILLIHFIFFVLGAPTPSMAEEEPPYTREENVVYALESGVGLVMDIFHPKKEKNGLAVIDVLSGAWYSEEGQVNDHLRGKIFDIYCSRGYTVFMVRPGSRTLFTAEEMVANIIKAIRFIQSRADKYGIDPEKMGITGASAGGHLTLLTLATGSGLGIRAGAVFFPPTDFLDYGGEPSSFERLGDILFRGGIAGKTPEEVEAKAAQISPARRVEKRLPPILLIHGDADRAVPLQQSEKMLQVLKDSGGEAKLIVKEGGGHPWPTIPEEVAIMADWFDEKLRP